MMDNSLTTIQCSICRSSMNTINQLVKLRDGQLVCKDCIYENRKTLTAEIDHSTNNIIDLQKWCQSPSKSGKNIYSEFLGFDALRLLSAVLIILIWIINIYNKHLANIIIIPLLILLATSAVILFLLKGKKDKKLRHEFNIELAEISDRLTLLQHKKAINDEALRSFYSQLWERPPDWKWRRTQVYQRQQGYCEECNCILPDTFDVHHIVPKSDINGNHSLDNLRLLCRKCHSKSESPGHELLRKKKKLPDSNKNIESLMQRIEEFEQKYNENGKLDDNAELKIKHNVKQIQIRPDSKEAKIEPSTVTFNFTVNDSFLNPSYQHPITIKKAVYDYMDIHGVSITDNATIVFPNGTIASAYIKKGNTQQRGQYYQIRIRGGQLGIAPLRVGDLVVIEIENQNGRIVINIKK